MSCFEIKAISFEVIRPIWADHLWPGRADIEPASAMLIDGSFSMENFKQQAFYFALMHENQIVGVNSGHGCVDNSFRSRGLWVHPSCRNNGMGASLLNITIDVAKILGYDFCWSLPKKTSWSVYQSVGFELVSDWFETDTSGANAYCKLKLIS